MKRSLYKSLQPHPAVKPVLADNTLNHLIIHLVICVGVRPVTCAVAAIEVVIVLISDVFFLFGLWNRNECKSEHTGKSRQMEGWRFKELTGISWHWKSPNLLFPQSQRKFLQVKHKENKSKD